MLVAALLGATAGAPSSQADSSEANSRKTSGGPQIDIWYGREQTFGSMGLPQTWANILGRVGDPDGVATLSYQLNGGSSIELSIGPDGRRLENKGDFNIDIAVAELEATENSVVITAVDGEGNASFNTVAVNRDTGKVWPMPSVLNWSRVRDPQSISQVVDGLWSTEGNGLRTTQPGYDRFVAIGDMSWRDYQVEVPITLHDLSAEDGGVGLLMRWTGHTDHPIPDTQPKSGFLPLGCIGWYRKGRIELYGNESEILASQQRRLSEGLTYNFKMRVESVDGDAASYRLKVWEAGSSEPGDWDLEGRQDAGPRQGSVLLTAHQYDVTFGAVVVTPVTTSRRGLDSNAASPAIQVSLVP